MRCMRYIRYIRCSSAFYQSLVKGAKSKARPAPKQGGEQGGAAVSSLFAPVARRGQTAEQFGIVHYGGAVYHHHGTAAV